MSAVALSTRLNRFAAVVRSRTEANGLSTTLVVRKCASAARGRRGRPSCGPSLLEHLHRLPVGVPVAAGERLARLLRRRPRCLSARSVRLVTTVRPRATLPRCAPFSMPTSGTFPMPLDSRGASAPRAGFLRDNYLLRGEGREEGSEGVLRAAGCRRLFNTGRVLMNGPCVRLNSRPLYGRPGAQGAAESAGTDIASC